MTHKWQVNDTARRRGREVWPSVGVIKNAARVPCRRSLSANPVRANAKGMSVVETARTGVERCTAESGLLTQSRASSLARLPVGNDHRDSHKVSAHSSDVI